MVANYYMTLNGTRLTDYGVAKYINDNLSYSDTSAEVRVNEQIDFLVKNFKNLNTINIPNALQKLWYDFIGIASQSIWKYIDKKVDELVEKGLAEEW